jgi:hypothetical protein
LYIFSKANRLSDNDKEKTSYDAQVDEYTTRIINNSEWELVKIYADEGISGTSTKKESNSLK